MTARTVFLAIAALAALVPAAQAQTTFGGGTLDSAAVPSVYTPTVGMTVQPRGAQAAFRFDTTVLCGQRTYDIVERGIVAFDGSQFAAKGASTLAPIKLDYAWELTATLTGGTITGELRVTGRQRRPGRTALACSKRPLRKFQLRAIAPPTGPPAPLRGDAGYFGASDLIVNDGLRAPVVLKATATGSRVTARWTAVAKCGSGPREIFVNVSPSMAIREDRSFSRSERFSQTFADAFVRYAVSFGGRVTTDGASGTLQLRTAVYNRRGGRLKTRCKSGVRNWTALLPEGSG